MIWMRKKFGMDLLAVAVQFLDELFRVHAILESLSSVDKNYRDFLFVVSIKLLVRGDIDFDQFEWKKPLNPLQNRFGLNAQVAVRLRIDLNSCLLILLFLQILQTSFFRTSCRPKISKSN